MYIVHTSKLMFQRGCLTRDIRWGGGVHGRNFEDRDFGFFAKFIICAQLTYSGGFVCPARGGARARTYHFFFTVPCVTYHFRVKWPCWTRFWPSNWFLNILGCLQGLFLTGRARTHVSRSIKGGGILCKIAHLWKWPDLYLLYLKKQFEFFKSQMFSMKKKIGLVICHFSLRGQIEAVLSWRQ